MKTNKILLLMMIMLGLGFISKASAYATYPFSGAYGNGVVSQDSYGEAEDIDGALGLSSPVVSWYTWPGAFGDYNYHISVDTDYGTGEFLVGYTVSHSGMIYVVIY